MTENELDEFTERLRANPEYQRFLTSLGIDLAGPIKLTDEQRRQAAAWLGSQGITLPKGIDVDPAWNLNSEEGFGKQLSRYAPIAAGRGAHGVWNPWRDAWAYRRRECGGW